MSWLRNFKSNREARRPIRRDIKRSNSSRRTVATYWLLTLLTVDTIFAFGITAWAGKGKPGLSTLGLLLLAWTVGRTGSILRNILK